jgi:hypothetical protein
MTQNNERDIETWYGREANGVPYSTTVVTREKGVAPTYQVVLGGLGGARMTPSRVDQDMC